MEAKTYVLGMLILVVIVAFVAAEVESRRRPMRDAPMIPLAVTLLVVMAVVSWLAFV